MSKWLSISPQLTTSPASSTSHSARHVQLQGRPRAPAGTRTSMATRTVHCTSPVVTKQACRTVNKGRIPVLRGTRQRNLTQTGRLMRVLRETRPELRSGRGRRVKQKKSKQRKSSPKRVACAKALWSWGTQHAPGNEEPKVAEVPRRRGAVVGAGDGQSG